MSIYAFQSGGAPSRYLIKNETADKVEHITDKDYAPCGCTPLYDAIGVTVNTLREIVKTHENAIGSVTIITDGMENSSQEYSHKQVADLIENLKKEGWNFNFIGANIDAEAVSRSMNIDNAMAFEQSVEGTHAMFSRERKSRGRWYSRITEAMNCMSEDMMADEESFKSAMRKTSENYFEEDK